MECPNCRKDEQGTWLYGNMSTGSGAAGPAFAYAGGHDEHLHDIWYDAVDVPALLPEEPDDDEEGARTNAGIEHDHLWRLGLGRPWIEAMEQFGNPGNDLDETARLYHPPGHVVIDEDGDSPIHLHAGLGFRWDEEAEQGEREEGEVSREEAREGYRHDELVAMGGMGMGPGTGPGTSLWPDITGYLDTDSIEAQLDRVRPGLTYMLELLNTASSMGEPQHHSDHMYHGSYDDEDDEDGMFGRGMSSRPEQEEDQAAEADLSWNSVVPLPIAEPSQPVLPSDLSARRQRRSRRRGRRRSLESTGGGVSTDSSRSRLIREERDHGLLWSTIEPPPPAPHLLHRSDMTRQYPSSTPRSSRGEGEDENDEEGSSFYGTSARNRLPPIHSLPHRSNTIPSHILPHPSASPRQRFSRRSAPSELEDPFHPSYLATHHHVHHHHYHYGEGERNSTGRYDTNPTALSSPPARHQNLSLLSLPPDYRTAPSSPSDNEQHIPPRGHRSRLQHHHSAPSPSWPLFWQNLSSSP